MAWQVRIVSELSRGGWHEDHYATVEVWGVTVHNARGRRFVYTGPYDVGRKVKAEKLAERVRHAVACGDPWTPIDNPHWKECDPVYGSEEYERQDVESIRARREREDALWEDFARREAVKDSYMA